MKFIKRFFVFALIVVTIIGACTYLPILDLLGTAPTKSPLKFSLQNEYQTTYNTTIKSLGNSEEDKNRKLVVKIGLQILQSKTLKYENELHFYSLDYTASGDTKAATTYSLTDCISRINKGQAFYTDCFGFVRLTYSMACYQINPQSPGSVKNLSGLYGYQGSYVKNNPITSLSLLKPGDIIYDTTTGTGSSTCRHVAMFLYATGNQVTYIDQSGIFTGEYKSSSYIYYPKSNPYKYTNYKSYC